MAEVRLELKKEEMKVDDSAQKAVSEKRNEIARLLLKSGRLTDDQLSYARRVHTKLSTPRSLLSVLEELQYVSAEDVRQTLQETPVSSIPLGSLLVELGYLTEADLEMALGNQKNNKKVKFGRLLVDLHMINENDLLKVLSYQLGFPYIDPDVVEIDHQLLQRAPLSVYRENLFLPLYREKNKIFVIFADPLNKESVRSAEKLFGDSIVIGIARERGIVEALLRLEQEGKKGETASGRHDPSDNVIVQTVNSILLAAYQEGASDVHVEPMKDKLQIRFRQDGVLILHKELPHHMIPGLTSRIKILAGADIAERRRHQDGRIFFKESGIEIDLRVSVYATIYGEKIVMRLLGGQSQLLKINELGMAPRIMQRFMEEGLDAPSGVIIITGPTGSGKTSTLYSAVNHLNNPNCSIITAEDPVEYVIEGIAQCSINPKINVTFEETLKHIVRQDPDIIVIGEIRDRFSAEMAIEAALTGHKVLTTFHTEDSTGALLRLLDMDIEPFLVASTVTAILSQRLVRRICPHCSEDYLLTPDEMRRLGYSASKVASLTFKKGKGCGKCCYSGYKGRLAIHELLIPGEMVKDAVIARNTSHEIRKVSTRTTGLISLLEDGIVKAVKGITSFNELIRQLPRLDKPRPVDELKRMLGEK